MVTQKVFTTGSECPPLEAGTLRLYSMRLCPFAQKTRIVLAYKNIPYETVNCHLQKKPEWLLQLNPTGTVPVMQKDDVVLPESLVICEYLDAVYPGEKVVQSDPLKKAQDSVFQERWSKIVTKFYGVLRGLKEGPPSEETAKEIVNSLNILEEELKKRNTKFFGGDKPMLLDFSMWPHFERMLAISKKLPCFAVNAATQPLLTSWVENITSVPAVKATSETAETHLGFYATARQGTPNYDYGLEE